MTPVGPDSGVEQARSLELGGLTANQKIQGLLRTCNAKPPFRVRGSVCASAAWNLAHCFAVHLKTFSSVGLDENVAVRPLTCLSPA